MDFNIDALKKKKKNKRPMIFFVTAFSKATFESSRFMPFSRHPVFEYTFLLSPRALIVGTRDKDP